MARRSGALDQSRWLALWSRLGARSSGTSTFARLAAAYAEPGRVYHSTEHIQDCLAELDQVPGLARNRDEVEAAIWFHDAVYLPGGSDNEEQSAELARAELSAAGVPADSVHRIAQLVIATEHRALPTDPDAQLVCDIDLSILGREPSIFDEFERRIRREYAWVPDSTYRRERSAVLSRLLRRSAIYQTQFFRHRYEATARANIDRLLSRLAG